MEDHATLLAGPILRRATVEGVYVWLTFDHEVVGINAEVYQLEGGRRKLVGEASSESLQPLQLGQHLYVYLVKLVSHQTVFDHDTLYCYEIIQNTPNASRGFLGEQPEALAYASLPLPSFFLPKQHRRIAHASCRKPHAAWKPGHCVQDQFVALDVVCTDSAFDLKQRPSQLFLTGDQIYADDVSLPMLLLCARLGLELTGHSETLPSLKSGDPDVNPFPNGVVDRKQFCNAENGFTSGKAHCHLLTFSELMMMYLLVSGGVPLERRSFPNFDQAKQHLQSGWWKRLKQTFTGQSDRELYNLEVQVLHQFLESAKKYRRVLANVPTYMMMDDHDVTDDWNISPENFHKIRTIPFSRRVISNALSAAWVFQLWGNDPERFSFLKQVVCSAHLHQNPQQRQWLETQLIEQSFWWGFSVPTQPAVCVLDTRTRRSFEGGELALMDQSAFDQATALMENLAVDKTL